MHCRLQLTHCGLIVFCMQFFVTMSSMSFRSFQLKSADESRWHSPKSHHSAWTSVANYLQPLAITALVFLVSTTSQLAYAYPQYGDLIPNYGNVPNPCIPASNSSTNATNTTQIWIALGHLTSIGGGARNPFGIDFSNFGRVYASVLLDFLHSGRVSFSIFA